MIGGSRFSKSPVNLLTGGMPVPFKTTRSLMQKHRNSRLFRKRSDDRRSRLGIFEVKAEVGPNYAYCTYERESLQSYGSS